MASFFVRPGLLAALAALTTIAIGFALWPGAGPAAAAPARDGRVIVHAMEYPWSAIGRVNAGGRGYCTGVLIGERKVLTEARCLYYATEGRWWNPAELHFVAGYQRDTYRIHSGVARYQVATGYNGGAGSTLANLTNNWALLTLERPIGRRAGWIALEWLDGPALTRLERGDAYVLEAGYRAGQSHVITVTLDCTIDSLARRELLVRGGCRSLIAQAGLAKILFSDGEFRTLAPQLMPRHFAKRDAGGRLPGASHAPGRGSPAGRLPRETIRRLLDRLGYLDRMADEPRATRLQAAIMAFQDDRGLRTTGEPSVGLLGRLIPAAPTDQARGKVTARAAADGRSPAVTEPGVEIAAVPGGPAGSSGTGVASTAPGGGDYVIQLASLPSADRAARAQTRLQRRFSDHLAGFELLVEQARLSGRGTVYRIRTGPFGSLAAARDACARFRARRHDCLVVRR